jgi:hypothetical protein
VVFNNSETAITIFRLELLLLVDEDIHDVDDEVLQFFIRVFLLIESLNCGSVWEDSQKLKLGLTWVGCEELPQIRSYCVLIDIHCCKLEIKVCELVRKQHEILLCLILLSINFSLEHNNQCLHLLWLQVLAFLHQ